MARNWDFPPITPRNWGLLPTVISGFWKWSLLSQSSLQITTVPVLTAVKLKCYRSSRKTSISALLTMPKPLTVWITINCGKFWKRWGIRDHLTCLLRNLYAGQEVTVRARHGTKAWFQIWKEVRQGCVLSPCLFNLYAEYIMRNAGLRKHKLESRLLGEISITSDMQMTPPL